MTSNNPRAEIIWKFTGIIYPIIIILYYYSTGIILLYYIISLLTILYYIKKGIIYDVE